MSISKDLEAVVARNLQDADLVFLANLANKADVGFEVTLFVKGCIITGKLISGKKYYSALSEKFDSYSPDSYGALVKEYLLESHKIYSATEEEIAIDDDSEDKDIPLNFMHLENVSLHSGGGAFQQINGGLLRLKIEEVDGYIFGAAKN
ncbi:hypothetical protein [Pantoea agglomerans]|uniref:hypothetical protein n=1 Tax=Enterobacter agglomerans TaxID=549 RepID=UPI000DAD93E2|nr:hypothetical protein [Pantoea agglomerans]RAH34144.1 hypothetical protein DOT37_07925 [Pantoea agglomerans]TGX94364.1 hypothetical protein E5821_07905 [Pantoea agglomerans]